MVLLFEIIIAHMNEKEKKFFSERAKKYFPEEYTFLKGGVNVEKYDPELAGRVWQRVRGGEPPEPSSQPLVFWMANHSSVVPVK